MVLSVLLKCIPQILYLIKYTVFLCWAIIKIKNLKIENLIKCNAVFKYNFYVLIFTLKFGKKNHQRMNRPALLALNQAFIDKNNLEQIIFCELSKLDITGIGRPN